VAGRRRHQRLIALHRRGDRPGRPPRGFPDAAYLYSHASALNDITSGNNVNSPFPPDCGGYYQCNAVPGYDGPTGNGTPNGLGAF
jgi:hypothetical protein